MRRTRRRPKCRVGNQTKIVAGVSGMCVHKIKPSKTCCNEGSDLLDELCKRAEVHMDELLPLLSQIGHRRPWSVYKILAHI